MGKKTKKNKKMTQGAELRPQRVKCRTAENESKGATLDFKQETGNRVPIKSSNVGTHQCLLVCLHFTLFE